MTVQNALCKMHGRAECNAGICKIKHNILILKHFILTKGWHGHCNHQLKSASTTVRS
ncbi:hypothetical protein EMIT047CA2_150141 [Pseudomonas soli]